MKFRVVDVVAHIGAGYRACDHSAHDPDDEIVGTDDTDPTLPPTDNDLQDDKRPRPSGGPGDSPRNDCGPRPGSLALLRQQLRSLQEQASLN